MMSQHQNRQLRNLFQGLVPDVPKLLVDDISDSSRVVAPGGLFLACAGGRRHGLSFLPDALTAGAKAVAWEPVDGHGNPELPNGVTGLAVPNLRRHLGLIADRFFGEPSAALTVTGATGTNGKTTTAYLAAQALSSSAGPAAYMGTLGYGLPGDLRPSRLTTPSCVETHRRLRHLADAGAKHAVIEVSSHGLDQGRVDDVRFQVAALTNLSRDHLDYHGDMSAYAAAKARLFLDHRPHTAVINVGDQWGERLSNRLPKSMDLVTVALVSKDHSRSSRARLLGRLTGTQRDGLGIQLGGDFGEAVLHSSLWGEFNAENLVVALGILLAHGLELCEAADALSHAAAPPGRMQRIAPNSSGPAVIVDFAHTPDALDKALRAIRAHTQGQLWCVFGCGGDRDQGKRPAMGEVAAAGADHIVVTTDNPRHENPDRIVAGILAGIGANKAVEKVADRRAAIKLAIQAARASDVVLIAGKGHETTQQIGDQVCKFSDADTAAEFLSRTS